jgi:hypothetical protein
VCSLVWAGPGIVEGVEGVEGVLRHRNTLETPKTHIRNTLLLKELKEFCVKGKLVQPTDA